MKVLNSLELVGETLRHALNVLATVVPEWLKREGAAAALARSLCLGTLRYRRAASVTWDGYVSYDGVLYGLPGSLQLAGKQVQVRERKGVLSVWSAGTQVFEIEKRPRSRGVRAPC